MAAIKTRIANGTIVLIRAGKRIKVKAGEKFDFTQEELDSVLEVNPDAVRKPINEMEDAPTAKVPAPAAKPASGSKSDTKPEAKSEDKGAGGDEL